MERRWRSWSALRVTPLHGAPTFTVLRHCTTLRLSTIPTGLNQPAQGCEERATLGTRPRTRINPERVASPDQQSPAAAFRCALLQPFQGWRFGWVGWTQGSFVGTKQPWAG